MKKTNQLLAIVDRMDALRAERDEARALAGQWRASSEECGAYSLEPFPWEQPAAASPARHSHQWSKWKPLPPDGDHGYQCETCGEIDWGK